MEADSDTHFGLLCILKARSSRKTPRFSTDMTLHAWWLPKAGHVLVLTLEMVHCSYFETALFSFAPADVGLGPASQVRAVVSSEGTSNTVHGIGIKIVPLATDA